MSVPSGLNLFLMALGWAGLVVVCALAWWKAGAAERIGSTMNLLAAVFAMAAHLEWSHEALAVPLLVVDAALALGFLVLALRFASLWLGIAMLLQAVQFSLHGYYFVAEKAHDLLYMWINNLDTDGVQLCILAGVIFAWRKRSAEERAAAEKAAAAGAAA